MKFFHILPTVVFIGLLAAGIQAGPPWESKGKSQGENVTPNKVDQTRRLVSNIISLVRDFVMTNRTITERTEPRISTTPNRTKSETQFGEAAILYFGEGQICNGVHFTPWIILTTASCVQGRDINRLYTQVLYKEVFEKSPFTTYVRVYDVTIHPKYDPKRLDYNFAMMTIYGKFDWVVEPYRLPRHDYTTEEILKSEKRTELDEVNYKIHEYFYIRASPTKVTTDFEVCGELGPAPNWYCAVKNGKFTKSNIGTAMFFKDKYNSKRLLGLYTGRGMGKDMKGHIFEKTFLVRNFIEYYISQHILPPFF